MHPTSGRAARGKGKTGEGAPRRIKATRGTRGLKRGKRAMAGNRGRRGGLASPLFLPHRAGRALSALVKQPLKTVLLPRTGRNDV